MTKIDGCLPFADHRSGVDTNPLKSIAGRLAKSSLCRSAVMDPRNPIILCVDDEPINCELLENILVANGYEVIIASNGKEALLKIKTREIDLVLLDVMMPELNGFEVCREIKESKESMNIPVIMITALSEKADRIKGIEAGAEEFLIKPFDKAEVLARIKMLLKVKDLEAVLEQSEKHYRVTQCVINMILSESLEDIPLALILQKALNMILSIPGLSFEPIGSIYLVEDEPDILVMKAQSNLSGPVKKLCKQIPFGTCLCGLAAKTRQIQSADHIDDRHGICYEGMVSHGHYAVPILFGGRALGVINIYLKEGVIRNQKEEDFLLSIANTLAGIIVRRQVEDERARLHTQLLQAQKMEAVGQLAGGISHDFNNILTAMMGYGHILKMKLKEEDPLRTYADHILSLSDKAANLTQSLLSFSRKRVINPEPVNLNEVIKKIDHLLSRIIGEDIRLQTMLSEEGMIIMADQGQIEQVLMNLATNARDAMPEGGFLSIGTEKIAIDEEFIKEYGFGQKGQYVIMSVADTGAGMDRETREKIFEPFFTTKEVGKGTGLGLSMVYGMIKQHEGYINVYSEPGRGTTFRIYLPLTEAKVEDIKPEVMQPVERGTGTVLLAEDETEVREFTKKLLEEYGYKVITAASGQEAINEFKAYKDKIQLMLLDVIMPNKNGREAYEEIKKIRPDIKVLFMSGYPADIIHKHKIIEKGFAYIEKPASPTKLLRKIREVLGK